MNEDDNYGSLIDLSSLIEAVEKLKRGEIIASEKTRELAKKYLEKNNNGR